MSNVKAGDLAVIVVDGLCAGHIGRFVNVIARAESYYSGQLHWSCEVVGSPLLFQCCDFDGREIPGGLERSTSGDFEDVALRPIRPQDDDAQDESKAWLPPVPTKEHA